MRGDAGAMIGRRAAFLSIAAAAACAGPPAVAHEDHPEGISARLLGVIDGPDGVELDMTVSNQRGVAVTLRGLSAAAGAPIALQRKETLFGFDVWSAVRFLRLDPGEVARLAPPAYRVLARETTRALFLTGAAAVRADFGPAGVVEIPGLVGP